MRHRLAWLSVAGVLSGCAAVGPDYTAPNTEKLAAAHWSIPGPEALQDVPSSGWGEFSDLLLRDLQERALRASPTMEAATARLQQARSALTLAEVQSLPSASGSAGARRQGQEQTQQSAYSLGFDASWELDLFGGHARAQQAASARSKSARLNKDQVALSLKAEVASAYFNHVANRTALDLAERELSSRKSTQDLVAAKVRAGAVSPQELDSAQAGVLDATGAVSAAQARCQQSLNQLALLTAMPVQDLPAQLSDVRALPSVLRAPDTRVPAEVLARRPDVSAAEQQLAAASADLGVTQAKLLPSIRLLGTLGVNTMSQAGTLTESWSFGPALALPILSASQRRAAVEEAQSRYGEALASWKSVVLQAVKEVEDGLSRVTSAEQRKQAAQTALSRQQRIHALVQARYAAGAVGRLELEEASRAVLSAEKTLRSLQLEYALAHLAVRKALAESM